MKTLTLKRTFAVVLALTAITGGLVVWAQNSTVPATKTNEKHSTKENHSCCAESTAPVKEDAGCPGHSSGACSESHSSAASPTTGAGDATRAAYDAYFQAQMILAGDSIEGLRSVAEGLAGIIEQGGHGISKATVANAKALAAAKDISAAREAYKNLSQAMAQTAKAQKLPYREAYCPMAKAAWLQKGTVLINPYMGKSMIHCGAFKS